MALKAERHIVARLFAKAATKLGLATTIAALLLTALPIASAVAQGAPGQISAARAAALLRLWIVLRLWMSGFQLLGTLRNKLLCTLGRLRQQLRHGLPACEIRLRRTLRTEYLLRVPRQCASSVKRTPPCIGGVRFDAQAAQVFLPARWRGAGSSC